MKPALHREISGSTYVTYSVKFPSFSLLGRTILALFWIFVKSDCNQVEFRILSVFHLKGVSWTLISDFPLVTKLPRCCGKGKGLFKRVIHILTYIAFSFSFVDKLCFLE